VVTTRLGGGRPMFVCYVAGFPDPNEAREAVRKHIEALDGDDVRDPAALSDGTVKALGINPGDVWMA
jgi:hypothetical protein